MPMQHIEENLLDQYALGTIAAESIAELEEHLLICSICQRRLVEADQLLFLLREAVPLEGARTPPPWWKAFYFRTRFLSGAAAVLLARLIMLISGECPLPQLSPAILLMESLHA